MKKTIKTSISLVLALVMILQVSPLSALTINAAETHEPIETDKGIVYEYYGDISTYRTGTLSYPKKEGYVFGGWYEDGQTTALTTEDTTGSAWAKYVPEDVLTVKAQVSQRVADVIQADGTLVADTSLKLRLVSSVDDSEQYETVGFKIKIGTEQSFTAHFFDSISAREVNNTATIEPDKAFHKASSQFATVVIGGFDSIERIHETELCVTPYWVTLDGTTVEGIVRTRLLASDDRASDTDGSKTNETEDFTVSGSKYSYGETAQSEAVSYKYFRGASDTVYLKGQYTPNGANVKFGIIIRNGGQTRQVLFSNAGVLVTNGVDGAEVTASGLVSGTYDAYDDVTNADGVYVWARNASVADDGTTYTATSSAIMDLLAGTSAKEVTWAIEENVLYCNIAGETVLRLPMNLLCEQWQDGRYYQVGVAAYNIEAQATNGMAFEKTALTFGKNAYAADGAEGIISEGNDVATLDAMAYEPITGAYKAATQAGTAYAYGTASTDAQLLTTTIQLPEADNVTSSNGIYLKSGDVYATILIGGTGSSATIQINQESNSNYKITITDWIKNAGITEYYSGDSCEVTAGIQNETLYLFINGKLAGSVDLYKLLSYYGDAKYYIEGSSSVQLGVCAVNSNNGNAAFQEYELVTGETADSTLIDMLSDENTDVAREWELFVNQSYYTNGKGNNMSSNGYEHTATTTAAGNCHIYGVPTTMPQKVTATLTLTDAATENCIIVRYGDNTKNYVYGITGFGETFEGYNYYKSFSCWGVAEHQVFYEAIDSAIYNQNEDGSYSYDVTAVVKDGCVYISYNDKVMFTHQLPGWSATTAVRLGVYSQLASGATISKYENVHFEAGSDVDVPQFMMTSNMTYDTATGVYTPDSSQTELTYAYSTAAAFSQLMSTTITLPEDNDSITSSNGLYLKSGDVYATITIAGTGTDVSLQINSAYNISIGDWLSKAGVTEYYKDGTCKLSAGVQDDTLYLFINDTLAGSVDLYKILTYYDGGNYYIEGSSAVQLGVCSLNPANGQVTFQDYSMVTGKEADSQLAALLAKQTTDDSHEWEIFADNNFDTTGKGYNGVVDGYEHTITNAQYGTTHSSTNCHFYGVPTTMPIKVKATLTSTAETAGHGIIVRYGTDTITNRIYGIHVGESTFYGVTAFKWANRATSRVYQETFDEAIYKDTEDGSYTYDITAVVKDGYLNVIYNDEVVFSEYLKGWAEGNIVRLGLYTYCPNGEDASAYSNVSFETAYDHEFIDIDKEAADSELLSALSGKKISVLGDSISTFVDVSSGKNAATTNSTIENNAVWYTIAKLGKWQHTYWGRMIEKYDMSLCVNNSASGGMLVRDRNTTTQVAGITRCEQLHDNTGDDAGTTPDIIALYLGANDLMQNVEVGELTEDTYASIKDSEGNYITEDLTYTQGYIILLDKVTKLYPNADVFCFTLLPTGNEKSTFTTGKYSYEVYRERRLQYNDRIREIAAHYGVTVVDLAEEAGFTPDNMATYFDGSHPLYQGIYPVSKVFEDALKTKYCGN